MCITKLWFCIKNNIPLRINIQETIKCKSHSTIWHKSILCIQMISRKHYTRVSFLHHRNRPIISQYLLYLIKSLNFKTCKTRQSSTLLFKPTRKVSCKAPFKTHVDCWSRDFGWTMNIKTWISIKLTPSKWQYWTPSSYLQDYLTLCVYQTPLKNLSYRIVVIVLLLNPIWNLLT